MARIVCQILHRPNRVTFVWSEGGAFFEPYHLEGLEVQAFYQAARDARSLLSRIVDGSSPQAGRELAQVGYQLYASIFRHQANDPHAREIQQWLHDRHSVDSLDMLGDAPGLIPWNVAYDRPPDDKTFDPGSFWGFQYPLAVGKRVNPLRVACVLDSPKIVVAADPELLALLPDTQKDLLSHWAATYELSVLNSVTALRKSLKEEAPDILYLFGALEQDALRIGDGNLTMPKLRDFLTQAKQGNPDPIVFLQVSGAGNQVEEWASFLSGAVNTLAGVVMCEVPTTPALANRLGVEAISNFIQGRGLAQALQKARDDDDLSALAYSAFCPAHVKVASDESTDPDVPGPEPLPLPEFPYHPLVPFESEDRGLFTGREDDIARCAALVDEAGTHGLLLHGAGGVGKSSFLRAGLIPHLETEAVGYWALRDRTPEEDNQVEKDYPVVALRPGSDLIGQIAKALWVFCSQPYEYTTPTGNRIQVDLPATLKTTLLGDISTTQTKNTAVFSKEDSSTPPSENPPNEASELTSLDLWHALKSDPDQLAHLLDSLTRRLPFDLLLLVEQGEDLVLQEKRGPQQNRQNTLRILGNVLSSPARCKVILSVRTEFMGRLMDGVRPGPNQWRNYFLDELSEDQMVGALLLPTASEPVPYSSEIPRQKYHFAFEPELAEALVEEVRETAQNKQRSPLPLLQVLGAQLYERMLKHKENVITKADRKDQGPIEDVLSRFVTKKIKDLPISTGDRPALRALMDQLYTRQTDGTLVRELVPMREIAATWKKSTPLETVVDAASQEGLIEVSQTLVKGQPELSLGLPQESLAQAAAQWDEDRKRQAFGRSRIIDTLWIMIPMLFLASAITWTLTRRANPPVNPEETPAALQEQFAKVLEAQRELSRWPMYVGDMARAEQAWNNENPLLARQILLAQQPLKQTDLRDFEWYYLWNKIQGRGPESAGHKGQITQVAISPDGSTGASASLDGTVNLWNIGKGTKNATLQGHEGAVLAVAFSPDGKTIASAGADKTIRLWDVSAGKEKYAIITKEQKILKGHSEQVLALAFGPETLVSSGADKQVITWDLTTGTPAKVYKEHTSAVRALALSPDGKTIASAGSEPVILIHDGAKTLQTIKTRGPLSALAFSLDGKTVVSGGPEKENMTERGMIRFWDPAGGKETGGAIQHATDLFALAYVPQTKLLASSGKDNILRLWDIETGRQVSAYKGHLGWVNSFGVAAKVPTLFSGSYDGTVKIWSSLPPDVIAAHEGTVQAVLFTPDDKAVISGGGDGTVKFWDPALGKLLVKLTGLGSVTSLAYTNKEGASLLAAGIWNDKNEGEVRLWDVAWDAKEGLKTKELPSLKGHTKGVTCLAFSPDGKVLASGSADQTAIVWDMSSKKVKHILKGHEGEVRCLAFPKDGGILMTGGAEGKVRQWDIEDGKEFRLPLEVHAGAVNAVRFFFGVVGFITVGDDFCTKFWVWNPDKQPNALHQHRGNGGAVTSLAMSPNSNFVATGSMDRTVKLFDTQLKGSEAPLYFGKERFTFTSLDTPIRAVAVSPNNLIVAGGGEDGTIHFWRAVKSAP